MSPKYALVKRYYDLKVWNLERVRLAVQKGWITEAEFSEITGQAYQE